MVLNKSKNLLVCLAFLGILAVSCQSPESIPPASRLWGYWIHPFFSPTKSVTGVIIWRKAFTSIRFEPETYTWKSYLVTPKKLIYKSSGYWFYNDTFGQILLIVRKSTNPRLVGDEFIYDIEFVDGFLILHYGTGMLQFQQYNGTWVDAIKTIEGWEYLLPENTTDESLYNR